jgi:methyltransferase (TIGR00027 family)
MKVGEASRTAALVCMGRALAHGRIAVDRFADPTALALLPAADRAEIEALRGGQKPRSVRSGMRQQFLRKQAAMMVVRTVAIDDVVRAAAAPQVVILGAGFDGRAWRMPELADATVFEVDHPDSQRDKRARVTALTQLAREVRFVPVDFTRDDLDAALAGAGHDAARPTLWIWEGVVMYLTLAEVEATLAVVGRRSARGSQLVVLYHQSLLMTWLLAPLFRRLGEALRSSFTPQELRALLARHGFAVRRDENTPELARWSPELVRETRMMRHLRIAEAERI